MDKKNYICPKCKSRDWKFADPLKPSESMINLPEFANTLLECADCGYIGIFAIEEKKETK